MHSFPLFLTHALISTSIANAHPIRRLVLVVFPFPFAISQRREVFGDVEGLGEGTNRGACQYLSYFALSSALSSHYRPTTEIEGFFNLLYAHISDLWPVDSPETKRHVTDLLPTITFASAESATKYRMCVFHF